MGLLVVAMLPDVAEIVNGIQFARQNNIALSIEVGSSLAVQVCLIQMPVLVFISEVRVVLSASNQNGTFYTAALVFTQRLMLEFDQQCKLVTSGLKNSLAHPKIITST